MSLGHGVDPSRRARRPTAQGSRKVLVGLLLVVVLGLLGGVAARAWAVRRFRGELAEARNEMEAGLFGRARTRLTRLAAERPNQAEVAFQLGWCEAERGRLEEALAAWARIRADSPWAAPAAVAFAQAACPLGRLTEAERILRGALRRASPERPAARHLLLTLLGQQGRVDEARRSSKPSGMRRRVDPGTTSPTGWP
jgi:predicted Zn-dependent protease